MYHYQQWRLATSFSPLHALWDWQNMILPLYSKYWQRWPDWTIDISPWVNPGDSHPREWAFLLRWLVVSPMPACTCVSASASTGLSFPEPRVLTQSYRSSGNMV